MLVTFQYAYYGFCMWTQHVNAAMLVVEPLLLGLREQQWGKNWLQLG